jgi:ketosteroid isomerase-like protein
MPAWKKWIAPGSWLAALLVSVSCTGSAQDLTPAQTVARFHQALTQGEIAQVVQYLDPALVVYENGQAEYGLAEYRERHLPYDLDYSRQVQRQIGPQAEHVAGDWAWVTSQTVVSGEVGSKTVSKQQLETMILRRGPDGWKIVHIHWSARALKAGAP